MNEVAIIGGGPAGMAAALQLKRSGIDFLLLEKDAKGTLLKNAGKVENYLGFNATTGIELLKMFKAHLIQHNISPILEEVMFVDYEETQKRFKIRTNRTEYYARRVIVASGTVPKKLEIAKVTPLIAYELPPAHLKTREPQKIAIIGAGDAAFDYALNLAEKHIVRIFNRGEKIKALPHLKKLVLQNKNIHYKDQLQLSEIEEEKSYLRLKFNDKNAKSIVVKVDLLLIAIGREIQKTYYSSNLKTKEKQLIMKKLLFLAGDVKNGLYRQVALSTADGISIAMQICNECCL
jgi:thioredoxin reductase (NADPH)